VEVPPKHLLRFGIRALERPNSGEGLLLLLRLTLQIKVNGVEDVDICEDPCVYPFEDAVDVAWILAKSQLRNTMELSQYHVLNTVQDTQQVCHDGL
jgi:hypothetical protein